MSRLIREYQTYSTTGNDDILITATYIEGQLLSAGAEPIKDYTIMDCFKRLPFILVYYYITETSTVNTFNAHWYEV